MILRQFLHFDPVAISYLFGCGGKSAAAVVDPVGDIDPYLRAAEETGMAIVYVIDTHLPGHTPEHICLAVTDRTRADEPWFVFTGHTLMVGDLGRTELAASAQEGARELFRSIAALKALPDYVEVLPGAFSGSVCGRKLSGKPSSTIGFERRHNEAFRIDDEEAFVRAMLVEIPAPPAQAAELRAVNAGLAAVA
jgi:hydroxyacylglutathione hydrolase